MEAAASARTLAQAFVFVGRELIEVVEVRVWLRDQGLHVSSAARDAVGASSLNMVSI